MNKYLIAIGMFIAIPVFAQDADWKPSETSTITGRQLEVYHHGVKPEWGYKEPQQDTFIVVHPKVERTNAPLYVVLHSAGEDVHAAVNCIKTVGNHDIYRSPDDFYALYLDCRANKDKGDWWWGAPKSLEENTDPKVLNPVEKRMLDTVRWVMKKYGIDTNRVYLCGNSMGGSGTLGVGVNHGDLFAAIKANVPAGVIHVASRMCFPPKVRPADFKVSDPPIVIDYSAQNDNWSKNHELFIKAMNDRKYACFFYWGPFGHANNHEKIMAVNDLINSFDWLSIKKNEPYPVFSNASSNDPIPWPKDIKDTKSGQINAFFRWKNISDTERKLEISLFLVSATDLTTSFTIPKEAEADVSLRRIQNMKVQPNAEFAWTFGSANGNVKADAEGLITISGLTILTEPKTLVVRSK